MSDQSQMAPPKPTLQVSTAITTTDHGQIVVLAGWLCLAIGTSLSMARIYIRWPLNVLAGKDDIAYAVSAFFAFVQTAVIIDAVRRGFGRVEPELEDWQVVRISKVLYATDIIFLFSLWAGKLSVSFLFTRLARESNKMRLGQALTVLVSISSIVSIFSITLRGDISRPWSYRDADGQSILARWAATGAMSIITDLMITAFSVYLVWSLQMNSKPKSIVITAFALRLFVAPVTIIRLVSLSTVRADDLSFTYTLPETMTQLEMYCNLVAATLPCLRIFLTAWNTSFINIRLEDIDNDAYKKHVTTHSDTRSRSSAPRSQTGSSKQTRGFRSAHLGLSGGRSETIVESQVRDGSNDAASENSESAIIVKTTVDVSNSHRLKDV